MDYNRRMLITGALLGITAIVLGAFGAHGLKKVLDAAQLESFETGVKYQIYHALLLLICGATRISSLASGRIFYWLTITGVVFFSGSIYLLTTSSVTGFDITAFGIITPIGGLMLIAGWVVLLIDFMRKKS